MEGSAETAILATGYGLSHPELEWVAQDYVDELPESAIPSNFECSSAAAKWNARGLIPNGAMCVAVQSRMGAVTPCIPRFVGCFPGWEGHEGGSAAGALSAYT